ncbi:amidohydrolase/deacetylase family metallohydrolase [Terriglobus tenax]|uniref:amidohydrolase/deacetylase family metallohydrolase n=1 Tax=Terriglobus tenax TaxID=1111115 RepID=UPI0021DF5120|nr:amidohydrolase/deacetylase family metallohydrolase [Terriglobus tenax]
MLASCVTAANAQHYDLVLQHGHVIDPKNGIDGVMDIAVLDGKVAKVAKSIAASEAVKAVDATGLYVTPGLIDIHVHAYAGTGERDSYAGDNSLYPDGFTFRVGVTTVVDAGSSGWRSFEDFKQRVIDRSNTRVLAMLNIVGAGMRPGFEQNLDDMDGEATAKVAMKYPGLIVGIKSAHFEGPEWKPYEQAVRAGTIAKIPVMIDYGANRTERPLYDLLSKVLRPGDIYTHMYSGLRNEQDPKTGKASAALEIGRKRGIYFDVGHGGGSFNWTVAQPLVKQGFIPDSISTDIHITSMNAGMKDELNVADKMIALGLPLQEVVKEMTSNPAKEIQHPELGNLTEGSPADIAVLRVDNGKFGFVDMNNTVFPGTKKLICELTIHNGKVVYDLNGLTADPWNGKTVSPAEAKRFTTMHVRPEKPSVAH